eukprot:TRINITY_DN100_c0_g3_i2.p1 TRINITY_DN100_c0_g3~~TRINITY_DN100_c0_g3_i2.p1  ORF type:complete len:114 (-),score=75.22 TRINITY_DN100_c0_g3_i2:153-494(-)
MADKKPVVIDFKMAQQMEAQRRNEESKRQQLSQQKGTGDRPTQTLDTVINKTALNAPKKETERGVQKTTLSDTPQVGLDSFSNKVALNAPKLSTEAGVHKGDSVTAPAPVAEE